MKPYGGRRFEGLFGVPWSGFQGLGVVLLIGQLGQILPPVVEGAEGVWAGGI